MAHHADRFGGVGGDRGGEKERGPQGSSRMFFGILRVACLIMGRGCCGLCRLRANGTEGGAFSVAPVPWPQHATTRHRTFPEVSLSKASQLKHVKTSFEDKIWNNFSLRGFGGLEVPKPCSRRLQANPQSTQRGSPGPTTLETNAVVRVMVTNAPSNH